MLLRKHNAETYANMVSLFASNQRVAAVQPTGTGKSYLIMQLIADNPDKSRISLDNVSFITYTKLVSAEIIDSFDYIVLDEFHRCGADEWGRGVQELLDNNPEAKVFGTSATPIRYLDSGRNMADELFGGVYAVNMSLAEAIQRKILPLPVYVTSWYSFRGDIEQLEMKAEQSGNPRLKHVLAGKIHKAKTMIAELDVGIERIFEKHIPDRAGKYIVFCPGVERLRQIVNECDSWFANVNHVIHKYTVYAQNSASDKQFEDFRQDADVAALKLLFCVDMLNEGVHFDDIDGVIMLRATQSANVFYQQLGRALACSDRSQKPVIFDIVNNFETGDTAQQYASIMEIVRSGEIYDDEIDFELYDYVRDIREILNELNDTFSNSWELNFELLKDYVQKYGDFPGNQDSYEGVLIGKWCSLQRTLCNQGKLSNERIEKLNSLGFPWDIREESWSAAYNEFARITKKLGHFPSKSEMPEDKKYLFGWLNGQRNRYRNGLLDPERAQKLLDLGCEMSLMTKADWEDRFAQLKEFVQKFGRFPNNADAKSDELYKVLCTWINSQRFAYQRGKLSPERKAMLDEIGFPWNAQAAQWNENFLLLKKFYAENGTIPETRAVYNGVNLGVWYKAQYRLFAAGTMLPERLARFREEGIPLEKPGKIHKTETWLRYYNSYMEYLARFGHHPNSTERYNDLELRKWRSLQLKKMRLGQLNGEQVTKLRDICGDIA